MITSQGNLAVRKRNAAPMAGIFGARDERDFATTAGRSVVSNSSSDQNNGGTGWSKLLPTPYSLAIHRINVWRTSFWTMIFLITVTIIMVSHVRQGMNLWEEVGDLSSAPRTAPGWRGKAVHSSLSSSTSWTNSSNVRISARSSSSPPPLSSMSLDVHKRPGEDASIMLIHIGKAGGSAMREIVTRTRALCNNLKSNGYYVGGTDKHDGSSSGGVGGSSSSSNNTDGNDPTNDTGLMRHVCAFAKVTNWNQCIHLNRHHSELRYYNHFLIPVRNPVDRIVSWYNFERYIMNVDRTRYGERLDVLSRCYDKVDDLLVHGLDPTTVLPSSQSSSAEQNVTQVCRRVAKDCVTGRYPCYAHNFFNYEYYLESLLIRLGDGAESNRRRALDQGNATTWTSTTSSSTRTYDAGGNHDKDSENNQDGNNGTNQIRIDIVRAEHSAVDMNRTLELWTGKPATMDFAMLYIHRKPHDVDPTSGGDSYKTYVSQLGATRLCRAICSELIVYKTILNRASNLRPTDIRQSYQELDDRCGFRVDEVCGTEYTYRGIRKKRMVRLCDPIQTPPPPLSIMNRPDANSSHDLPRRRLFLHGNHPPC
jgi:hypothetical protein